MNPSSLAQPRSAPGTSDRQPLFWRLLGLLLGSAVVLPPVASAQTVRTPFRAAVAQQQQACFFDQTNFSGASFCIGEGIGNMPAGWDNKAASVKVPAGWRVDLLENVNLAGRTISLNTDAANLGDLYFIGLASSYRVVNVSAASSAPAPIPRPVSALCNGITGPSTETPLSSATADRSVPLSTDRKRVVVKCIPDAKNPGGPRLNVLRTDQNTPLRAGTSWVWKADQTPGITSTPAFFAQMRKAGLNAVRVIAFDVWEAEAYGGTYLSQFDDPAFLLRLRSLLETTVNNCSRYGMYCILNAHNKIGSVNLAVNQKFWAVMAPYFANRTHVIFEQSNEALQGSGIEANYTFLYPSTLATLRSGYNEMRAAAPNTHIMVLTPTGINGWGYVDAMAYVAGLFAAQSGPVIDWTNTSVAYHLYATDTQFGSPDAENLRKLHATYPGWPSENNYPPDISSATLNITDNGRSQSYAEHYINQTSEILGLGWSLWNIESPAQFTRNFPLIQSDAKSKGYGWRTDAKVAGEVTP